jgi:hypothetical protein
LLIRIIQEDGILAQELPTSTIVISRIEITQTRC